MVCGKGQHEHSRAHSMTVIDYPFGLATILSATKLREISVQALLQNPRRGMPYLRPLDTQAPARWSVSFVFSREDAEAFMLWFMSPAFLDSGLRAFRLPINDEQGRRTVEVAFEPDTLLPATEQGGLFGYTARLREV